MILLAMILTSFICMELASWLIHRYIMHGPLWNIHKSHHEHTEGKVELNDVFTLFFAGVAVVLLVLGLKDANPYFIGSGVGISLYGLTYFVLHDLLIHRRIKLFARTRNPFLNALTEAHRDHHKSRTKDGSTSFGLLLVHKKYYKKYYRKEKNK